MTTYYVDSAGSNTAPYDTWAKAATTLGVISAIDVAGDVIYVAHTHAESTAGAVTLAFANTATAPVKIICANTGAEPPTAVATTATITTTGSNAITITGTFYCYGIIFSNATGAVSSDMNFGGASGGDSNNGVFEQCKFISGTTTAGRAFLFNTYAVTNFKNCQFEGNSTSWKISNRGQEFTWDGGSISAGGVACTGGLMSLGTGANNSRRHSVSGVDFTNCGAAFSLFQVESTGKGIAYVRNCKMPASWSGSLLTGTILLGQRYEMYNCDSADTNYRMEIRDYPGTLTSQTTIVKTGGASDGTTSLSWKYVTTANAKYPSLPLFGPEIVKWNDTVGSAITVTVDFIHDSVTNLKDNEIWLEVQYLGTSGFPLSTFITDAVADVLATPADQTTSAATWTTTGLTNPNEQKLSVSFTPQEKGYVHAKVYVGKASYTVYIDPELQVS